MYSYFTRIYGYTKKINLINDKEDIKRIVKIMFEDDNLDDTDFNNIIYDFIMPKLKVLGVNLDNDDYTSFEMVMKEDY